MTWDLPHDLTLGLMPGIKYDAGEDSHRFASGILGAVLNKRLTENSRAFFEASATQLARGRDGGVLADWDIGAAYLLSRETQIGFRAGIAATRTHLMASSSWSWRKDIRKIHRRNSGLAMKLSRNRE